MFFYESRKLPNGNIVYLFIKGKSTVNPGMVIVGKNYAVGTPAAIPSEYCIISYEANSNIVVAYRYEGDYCHAGEGGTCL